MTGKTSIEPGFCVVQRPGSLTEQAMWLYGTRNMPAANYFLQLNADVAWAKPGQILIVADPEGNNHPAAMSALATAKATTNNSLAHLSVDEASFFHQHYKSIAAITNFMDTASGLISDAGEKYFNEISKKLTAIEVAYQNQHITSGSLISEQFYAERRRLFSELDSLLNRFSRLIINLRPYDKLKSALNLSSSSIVHDWQTAGVGAIRGYSTYVDGAAKATRIIKTGGWIAVGFSALNTTNTVYDACTVNRKNECLQVAVTEYSAFVGSTFAGLYGAMGASIAMRGACLAFGVATGPVGFLTCNVVSSVAGGLIASKGTEKIVKKVMEKIL